MVAKGNGGEGHDGNEDAGRLEWNSRFNWCDRIEYLHRLATDPKFRCPTNRSPISGSVSVAVCVTFAVSVVGLHYRMASRLVGQLCVESPVVLAPNGWHGLLISSPVHCIRCPSLAAIASRTLPGESIHTKKHRQIGLNQSSKLHLEQAPFCSNSVNCEKL